MNPQIKTKWVKALRSNKYRQGRYNLKIAHADGECSYCCLGVLCELYVQEGLGKWEGPEIFMGSRHGYRIGKRRDASYLPKEVREWAGLEPMEGEHIHSSYAPEQSNLWRMNDTDEKSFEDIADFIEEHL